MHPTPALGSGTGGGGGRFGHKEAREGRRRPRSGSPCVCSSCLPADCSLRCVCWLGSSSQAEQACRSPGVWTSQRGSGKVATPEDLQLNPQGWWYWWVGGLCIGLPVGVMSHSEQTRHVTRLANAGGGVMDEHTALSTGFENVKLNSIMTLLHARMCYYYQNEIQSYLFYLIPTLMIMNVSF